MDGTRMQALVYRGYAKAALRVGGPHLQYRPTGTANPIASGNLIGTLPARFATGGYNFTLPVLYGKATWSALVDGSQTARGDYLVDQISGDTWFIAAMQPLLPIAAVKCTAVLSFARPGSRPGRVFGAVSGDAPPAAELPILTAWPASMLAGTKGEKADDGLPRDTRQPWYAVLLPALAGAEILTEDIVTDARGHRYVVSSAELSALGWKLSVMYSGA